VFFCQNILQLFSVGVFYVPVGVDSEQVEAFAKPDRWLLYIWLL